MQQAIKKAQNYWVAVILATDAPLDGLLIAMSYTCVSIVELLIRHFSFSSSSSVHLCHPHTPAQVPDDSWSWQHQGGDSEGGADRRRG